MSKFVVVKEAPKELGKGEIVIAPPNFLEQIQGNASKAPRQKLTALHHLREILHAIGTKYDPELDVFKFRLVHYEGIAYTNEQELSQIILRILRSEYPRIFDKYLEHQIKNRPVGTKLIYYVGDFTATSPFFQAGLDHLEEKDLENFLTGKPKKIVGKPAITKEEAERQQS